MKYLLLLSLTLFSFLGFSQNKKSSSSSNLTPLALETQFDGLKFRNIGPARGGRSTAVAGIPSKPHTFLMGATGGGVWRTDDGGNSWNNITDGYLPVGSIGSIRVALSDPNVMYVGTGSADPRGNVSIGKGIYKSSDDGKTWNPAGLEKGGQIGKLQIHPQNPDLVYAAVLGNPFGPNAERGVYRTKDGGKTWDNILFVNDQTGAMDVVLDPNNPRILYAAFWRVERKPWTLVDGNADGGVWQSKDGGDSWKKLEGGLPSGVLGKIGLAVSPANSDRVWVLVESIDNEKGGLYRSDDGGKKFERINGDRELRTRHWYYTRVFADPKDEETVFVNNVSFWKSTNGGKEFSRIRVLHGDCHDLWINPDQTDIMIHSNDGGAHVTYNGGMSWSTLFNQPTAEIYRVAVDNAFPYRVYGCQQDNSSISVSSAVRGGSSYMQDWIHVGGGEAGHVSVNPQNPNIIYAGEYTGIITRYDREAEHMQYVTHYPQMHDGLPLYEVKYRYQWNAPIKVSKHNPKVVYHSSQFVHRSKDGGINWEVISPDLTTNKKEYQQIPGGPVQHDYTGVENYTTVFAMEESPFDPNVLMAGSDDGLVHITMDGGKNWTNITPKGLPALATVNAIDFSTFKEGKAYVTAHNYRLNDFKPYVFKTEDYGKTWSLISTGLPFDFTTRVVREDPNREGLLYAGTEFGLFVSMDDGKNWNTFQLNLPRVPITDLLIKNQDLVMSTQGRSFWILDDLTPLYQWKSGTEKNTILFVPRVSYRTQLGGFRGNGAPTPAPDGTIINFYLGEKPDSSKAVSIEILDDKGVVRRTYSSKPDEKKQEIKLDIKQGFNRMNWDYYYNGPTITPGSYFSMASLSGPKAPTGKYTVRLSIGDLIQAKEFTIAKDPRWTCSDADLMEAYDLTTKAVAELDRVHLAIRKLRAVRNQSNEIVGLAEKANKVGELKTLAESMNKKLGALEEKLIQTRHKAGQDPINYPPKFDDQIAWLVDVVNGQDAKPTQGCYDLYNDLKKESDGYMQELEAILTTDLKAFNDEVLKNGVVGVVVDGID